jgi:hypothetical protein
MMEAIPPFLSLYIPSPGGIYTPPILLFASLIQMMVTGQKKLGCLSVLILLFIYLIIYLFNYVYHASVFH